MTPTQKILAEAAAPQTVTDAQNRRIEFKMLRGREMSQFLRMCGDASGNEVWRTATMVRASVLSIDGTPVPPCGNMADLDDLWDRVDADAVEAVVAAMGKASMEAVGPDTSGKSTAPQA